MCSTSFFHLAIALFLIAALTACVSTLPPAPMATPTLVSTRMPTKDGMAQVYVPAGEFLMGSTEADIGQVMQNCSDCSRDSFKDEMPQHKVYLDAFWIDKTEVTNAMFAKFVAATGYKTDAEKAGGGITLNLLSRDWKMTQGANWQHPRGPDTDIVGLDNHPAVHMSYNDAQAYCQWAGRRLPTEAEWEKAARGTDRRMYPWGNRAPTGDLLNFADRSIYAQRTDLSEDDGHPFTAPVGSYPGGASPYGALDMAGNVWERVADWYSDSYYAGASTRNPTGPSSGDYVIIRGGSWSRTARYLRAAARYRYLQGNRSSGLGFRCAVSPWP